MVRQNSASITVISTRTSNNAKRRTPASVTSNTSEHYSIPSLAVTKKNLTHHVNKAINYEQNV